MSSDVVFNLIKTIINICFLRAGPKELSCSYVSLGFLIVISFLISVLIVSIIYNVLTAILSSIAGLFFSFAFTKILLLKKPERFLQTFSALLGTVTIINIVSLPSIYSLAYFEFGETAQMFFGLTGFALFVWVIIVYGYIFSKALPLVVSYGMAISVGYALLSIMIFNLFVAGSTPT